MEDIEKIVDKVLDVPIHTSFGQFMAGAYITTRRGRVAEHLLLYSHITEQPTNLRINSACFTSDIFGETSCDCNWQLQYSLNYIISRSQGLLIYHLHHEGRARGVVNKLRDWSTLERLEPATKYTDGTDAREYQSTIAILRDLGIQRVNLLSNSPQKWQALTKAGIDVMTRISVVSDDPTLDGYYRWKRTQFGHDV